MFVFHGVKPVPAIRFSQCPDMLQFSNVTRGAKTVPQLCSNSFRRTKSRPRTLKKSASASKAPALSSKSRSTVAFTTSGVGADTTDRTSCRCHFNVKTGLHCVKRAQQICKRISKETCRHCHATLLSVYPASSVSPTHVFTKHSVSSVQIQLAKERHKTHHKYEKLASHPARKQLELEGTFRARRSRHMS